MSFVDSMQALLDKVRQRTGGEEEQHTSNMANGGFSGYRPATAKHRVTRETGRQTVPEQATGYDMGAQQGAFTGTAQTTWQQPQQGTGYQQPQQPTGYQQGTGYQPSMDGYQQNPPYQQGTGYQAGWQGGWQQPPQQGGWQDQSAWGQDASWGSSQNNWQNGQATPNNISYFPGAFVGKDGRAYSHVERVAQVTQVPSCYRIIEFMRNGESVIVNTEMINDPAETDRCLDMLYGAACALGCTLTRISSQKEIYLLSPETVMVVPYDGIRRMSDQEINARWPDPDAMNDRYGYGRSQQGGYQERSGNYGRRGYAGRYDEGYGSYQSAYAR
ncbi:MAG: cell division protein SepF [Eubacteriales bacterium]|nr:cell division protein SepF [Eubacteriales bacterium]